MRLRTLIFGLAFSTITIGSLCEIAWSQEVPRGGERGGPGGGDRGGPGGGFRGGPGGSTRGGGRGIASLIRMEEVQTELKLTDDQKKELTAIGDKMRESMGFGGRPGEGGAPGGERQRGGRPGEAPQGGAPGGGRGPGGPGGFSREQMNEMMARLKVVQDKAESEIMLVLDPDQQDRILGLLIQREDAGSLESPSLRSHLTITPDQEQKLKAVNDKRSTEISALFETARAGGGQNEGMREQMEAMGKKTNSDLLAVLTAEQKAQYEALKGPAFTFPERQFGPGGPGGPGGGNRSGGDQNRPGGGRPGRPAGPGT